MLQVSDGIMVKFGFLLSKKNIPFVSHGYYKKWLRYYLDYCYKYKYYYTKTTSLPNYINKLKEKKQTGTQQKQAHESISIF